MVSIYDTGFSLIYGGVVTLILGACLGSFLNCAAIRTGEHESFVKGRSHCMSCGHALSAPDLIPVLSWVFLRGKCRYCGAKVSARYPLAEIVFALVCVGCLLRFDLTILCLRNFVLLAVLFFLTLTDLDTMIIPDRCHIIAALAWALSAPFLYTAGQIGLHVAAGVAFGAGLLLVSLAMDRIMGRDTLGGGDIKLMAVVGLYFGFIGSMFVLILSCLAGLAFNACKKKEFPFGPWIAGAAALMLFAGDPLINWYMGLIA